MALSSVAPVVVVVLSVFFVFFLKPEWVYTSWAERDIPELKGKVSLITGANTGLGFAAARHLLQHGAHVILACRSQSKCENAQATLHSEGLTDTELLIIDLSDFDSVKSAAANLQHLHRLDHLILNAGLMVDPPLPRTKEGYEMQFAINHLGHFALTLHLLPLLAKTKGSRVVPVSSIAHTRTTGIDFDDVLKRTKNEGSSVLAVYSETKLANLLFARELQHRLNSAGLNSPQVISCHPGATYTELQRHSFIFDLFIGKVGMSAEQGSLNEVRAAVDPTLKPLDYIGPSGIGGWRGYPIVQPTHKNVENDEAARRLWELSEQVTGVTWSSQFGQ